MGGIVVVAANESRCGVTNLGRAPTSVALRG
jgi:hypothetical protein